MTAVSGHARIPSGTPSSSPFADAPSLHEKSLSAARGRASLGSLLRRSKSKDQGLRGNKKEQLAGRQQELLPSHQQAVPAEALPSLPVLYDGEAGPRLETFGGDTEEYDGYQGTRPDSIAIATGRSTDSIYKLRPSAFPHRTSNTSRMAPITEMVDPYARTESMTHRGRQSYAPSMVSSTADGSINPRRVRRRKDPTTFNILILGTQNAGKTSFVNFLKTSLAPPTKKRSDKRTTSPSGEDDYSNNQPTNFVSHYMETEIDGERLGITLWDSEGLEKSLVDLQLREMSVFLDSKFNETFNEEMKVIRAAGVQDTHIHCAFLLLDPARLDKNIATVKARLASVLTNGKHALPNVSDKIFGGLDEDLDLNVIRTISKKTTVIPVISKADSITTAHMSYLKRTVWDSLRKSNMDPLEALDLEDEEVSIDHNGHISEEGDEFSEDNTDSDKDHETPSTPNTTRRTAQNRQSTVMESPLTVQLGQDLPFLPFSIISPDLYEPNVPGRKFPWGFADPFNPEHCDFLRLKDSVFVDWREELRNVAKDIWYEQWRTSRLDHTTTKSVRQR